MHAKKLLTTALIVLTLGFSSTVFAGDKEDAGKFADTLGHEAVKVITDTSLSKDNKRATLEKLFGENVDIDWIGKFVLGRNWKTATDDQKKQYLANYRTFIIKHYTGNLADLTDANFEITRVKSEEGGNGFIVTMRVKRENKEDAIIDYVVRKNGGKFMVYDIIVEGVSMITTQRSEFGSVVAQHDLNFLIAQLLERSKTEAVGSSPDGAAD